MKKRFYFYSGMSIGVLISLLFVASMIIDNYRPFDGMVLMILGYLVIGILETKIDEVKNLFK